MIVIGDWDFGDPKSPNPVGSPSKRWRTLKDRWIPILTLGIALPDRQCTLVRIVDETYSSVEKFMVKTSTVAPEAIAAGFHALSDPLRIQVLELLRQQELCVCELCEKLGVSQSKLSFHLKTLKEMNLIRGRQEGRWIYYSLHLPQLVELEQYLAEYRRFSPMLPGRKCDD